MGSIIFLLLAVVVFTACTSKSKPTTEQSKVPVTSDLSKQMHQVGKGQRPLWSPDGQHVVYLDHGNLVISKIDGDASKIILRSSDYGFPENQIGEYSWAPDGKALVFTLDSARRISEPQMFVYYVTTDRKQLLFSDPAKKFQTFYNLSWLAQNRLFFWANSVSSTEALILDVSTQKVSVVGVPGDMLSVAPDGTRLAYVQEDEGGLVVYLSQLDGRDVQEIANLVGLDSFIVHMTWSPDGRKLSLWANGAVFIVDVTKKDEITTLSFPESDQYPEEVVWNADSSQILVTTTQHIYYGTLDQPQLKTLSKGSGFASWSPDGKSLCFQSENDANQWGIWVSGKQEMVLAKLPELSQKGDKKTQPLNSGPDDGLIVLPKTSSTKLTNQSPEWSPVQQVLAQYFLGHRWQGYGKLDRLYRLTDHQYYAVVIVYYQEGESYYPEAYEVLLSGDKHQFKVLANEILPFSPEFTP